jgi:head-tail adaptor
MARRTPVNARELDEKVTIQRVDIAVDAVGDRTPNWVSIVECWARVDSIKVLERHREPVYGQTVQELANYECWVRADVISRWSVTAGHRIMRGGYYYDILDIVDNGLRGRFTQVLLRKGAKYG